ncbi:MAG: glycosyltransferase family 39 protein [Bacteroidota bacterium]
MQSKKTANSTYLFLLILFSLAFFIPFLGNAHLFDWDEINFAEISREMVITKNYLHPQMNFQLFTEKPPLFFWLQSISMNIFGINEFSSRLPNAILGLLVLPLLFLIGKKLKNNLFGFIWAIAYACTILPHLYFKSGIIDPWFNFFILLSLYGLIEAKENKDDQLKSFKWIGLAGIMAGLALLTKGPAAIIIIGITGLIFLITNAFKNFFSITQLLLFALVASITTGLWLGIDLLQNGSQFIREFTIRQWELFTTKDAGHGGFFFYHFVVLFFGCFPVSAFFIHAMLKKDNDETPCFINFKKWMKILFWVVLILFSIVQTKIVHYSSLCYYPISFFAAISICNLIENKWMLNKLTKILILISSIPFVIAPFLLVYFGRNKSLLTPLLSRDPFAVENIQANVSWTGWEMLPGIVLILCLFLCFNYFNKQKIKLAIGILFLGSLFFIQSGLYFFINRIESISQRANIEFWQQHAKEDCYKITYQYKSYSNYFYGEVLPQKNNNYTNQEWLLKGKLDKTVYISCKINGKDEFEKEINDAVFLYHKNGFYFYKRTPLL